jgi:4-amino-4-deoxy-L-arabinose transferase-like glycosyltransferase
MVAFFFVTYLIFSLVYLIAGRLNSDEGWYLMAARLVAQGKVPYFDFVYTQPPLIPYLYAVPFRIYDGGIVLGRIITMTLGILCFALTVLTARRLSGTRGAVVAAGLLGLAGNQIHQFGVVKTTAPASFFALLATYYLFADNDQNRLTPYLSILFMTLAAATRITFLPPVLIICLYYAYAYWKDSDKNSSISTILFGFAAIAVVFVPFLILSPRLFFFDVILFHNINMTGVSLTTILDRKLTILGTYVRFFPNVTLMLVPALIYFVRNWKVAKPLPLRDKKLVLFVIVVLVFFSQWVAGTAQWHYQSNIIPLLLILLLAAESSLYEQLQSRVAWRRFLNCFVALCILLGPMNWRKDVRMRKIDGTYNLPLHNVREIGRYVREHTSPDGTILTSRTFLAVEANRNVMPGLEMSFFSYFPFWSVEKCTKYHVVNNEILFQSIISREPEAIILRYKIARVFPSIGGGGNSIEIYLRE